MQTVNFKCGHCGNLMGVSAEFLGQQVRCPHCQQVVVAPAAHGAALEPTLQLPPSGPAVQNQDETAVLSSPVNDESSIFHEDSPTDDLFDEPKPPPLDLAAPASDATLTLEPSSGPSPAVPATLTEDSSSAPEIPDWMQPSTPGPAASTNGAIAELPAPATVKAPRPSSMGLMLFITLVFMPLVLYSVLVTVLAILIYVNKAQVEPPPDPRENLIDTQGDHPGAKKTKPVGRVLDPDMKQATKPLPAPLRIKLGDTIELGQLHVKAESVERGTIEMTTPGFAKAEHIDSLILRLHLKNVSNDSAFFPMDYWFTRKWKSGQGATPLTVLLAGDQLHFFGSPAIWNQGVVNTKSNPERRTYLKGSNYDHELKPGEEMDTFVCVDGNDPKWNELVEYQGPLVWHVHVRRGFVHWKDHDYPATAVFGVEFTDADVKKTD